MQIVREDPKNTNLLYAGTELGLFASYNGGKDWLPLNLKNLPNVAIHDILVHPRENDLISRRTAAASGSSTMRP